MDQPRPARRRAAIALQIVIVLIGITVLALILWEPHIEGRNAHATLYEIYFHDPFLAYAYTASIAFFIAVYQAFRLAGSYGRDELLSPNAVRALRTIKRCALALIVMIAAAMAYLFITVRGKDDIAGGVAMGLGMILISALAATAAAAFEKRVQRAVTQSRTA